MKLYDQNGICADEENSLFIKLGFSLLPRGEDYIYVLTCR